MDPFLHTLATLPSTSILLRIGRKMAEFMDFRGFARQFLPTHIDTVWGVGTPDCTASGLLISTDRAVSV